MRKISFFILIYSVLMYSCNKSSDTVPINSGLRKYFNYQIGTYWIYKDSIAGEIDSFYVTANNQSNETTNTGTFATDKIEIIQLNENNTASQTVNWEWAMTGSSITYISKNTPRGYVPLFSYPFNMKGAFTEMSVFNRGIITTIYPNYTVDGQNFSNVAETNYYNTNPGYNDWVYINSDIGIVKMRWSDTSNKNNKVWELQRWNIVR